MKMLFRIYTTLKFAGFTLAFLLFFGGEIFGLSILTWNVGGNGAADWSTNSLQVQALGRQVQYLNSDVITFQEIPFVHTDQMTNFVRAFLPGYFLATNSGTDGAIRSVIASRFPISRSQKWLDGASLTNFGYNGTFTRDLFEAEIQVPGYPLPFHVFTIHLKAQTDTNSAARRAAEAGAVSNFFVSTFIPQKGQRPYLLTGDLNEDVARPPSTSRQPIQKLVNPATGLSLTTPRNPVTGDDRTISIRSTLTARFDYILPGTILFSNVASSQVFRSDRLNPLPPGIFSSDSATASDHLPVLMTFYNPYDSPFSVSISPLTNRTLLLSWTGSTGRVYRIEQSTILTQWTTLASNVTAGSFTVMNTNVAAQFFRVYRSP